MDAVHEVDHGVEQRAARRERRRRELGERGRRERPAATPARTPARLQPVGVARPVDRVACHLPRLVGAARRRRPVGDLDDAGGLDRQPVCGARIEKSTRRLPKKSSALAAVVGRRVDRHVGSSAASGRARRGAGGGSGRSWPTPPPRSWYSVRCVTRRRSSGGGPAPARTRERWGSDGVKWAALTASAAALQPRPTSVEEAPASVAPRRAVERRPWRSAAVSARRTGRAPPARAARRRSSRPGWRRRRPSGSAATASPRRSSW